MNPFEQLLKELGQKMGLNLRVDPHQSCRLDFGDNVAIQIDLDGNADRILMGSELGKLDPGTYKNQIINQALRANGSSSIPSGTLAFSHKNDTLILFQFIPLSSMNGEKLYQFLMRFLEQTRIWTDALNRGEIPDLVEENRPLA